MSAFLASRQPGLAVAGLAGGLLTVFSPIPRLGPAVSGGHALDGVWLGLVLAVYFPIALRDRSLTRAACVVVLSTAANFVAFWAAWTTGLALMMMTKWAPTFDKAPANLPPLAMFVGGAVGGFLVCGGTFLLYIDNRARTGPAIAACVLAGGLLAVGGAHLGDVLRPPREPWTASVLFLTWQTGIGLVMGLLWPQARIPSD